MPGVQRLGHGAELGLQPCGPGAGDAERRGRGRGRGPAAAAAAAAAPKVPRVAVACQPGRSARAGVAADDALRVDTGAERLDSASARARPGARRGQHHRRDRHRRVADHGVVHVVVVVGVTGRAVDQGRLAHGCHADAVPISGLGWPPSAAICCRRMSLSGSRLPARVTPMKSSSAWLATVQDSADSPAKSAVGNALREFQRRSHRAP
jgi:hypothetical protein